jgi:pimeloyl-ACP methyl ester carboxylesterase
MGLGHYGGAHAPVTGEYLQVDGTRLHYIDRGVGTAVVLLHGNGSMIGDFISSGVTERMGPGYRVIAFDRPGFGYSERPRGRTWGPFEQARLIMNALEFLDIEQAVLIGHSWGTLVALAAAMENPRRTIGLVLLSGYYYPLPRRREGPSAGSPFPIMDDMVWQTVMPFVWRMRAPGAVRNIFAPCPVPEPFKRLYSMADALRPSQMRSVQEEAAMLPEVSQSLGKFYKDVSVPVRLIAGADDRIVDTVKHSLRLHAELAGSTLQLIPHCGHMVHHAAPDEIVAAVHGVNEMRARSGRATVRRQWLDIAAHSGSTTGRAAALH